MERYASFFQQYIIYADKTKEYLLKKYVSIIGEKKNVLGVLCRGTDYLNKRPAFHPVQPSPEVVINEIEGLMKVYRIDYIYLATEDIVILEVFREAFGDMVLCINQKRFDNIEEDYICDCSFQNEERIQMNLDYLASQYILSKCEYFIGGRTSGTIGVNLMPHNYRYTYFWNLGTYPNHD